MSPQILSVTLLPEDSRRTVWRVCPTELAALEALELPLWVACAWDQRPPQGLAGRCDWRLRGSLSRQLQAGRLDLSRGEVTLVGAAHRLGGASLLVLGLGEPSELAPAQASALGRETADRIHGLGHRCYGLEPVWSSQAPQLALSFMAAHLRRRRELVGSRRVHDVGVTWILPEGLRLCTRRPPRTARFRRARQRTQRHHRAFRGAFFSRRRKK